MSETPETVEEQQKNTSSARSSREPLFGAILFGFFSLVAIIVVVGIGWGVYQGYQVSQERAVLPSIATITLGDDVKETTEEPKEEVAIEEKPSTDTVSQEEMLKKAQAISIKVLNGGAPKGSASVVAGALTRAGFTKVEIGNTLKDYTGVVIYFAPEAEKEAETVKATLLKSYPNITTQSAIKTNTETTQAPLSIIFGK